MNKKTSLSLRLELIWWLVTLLILVAILFPIYTKMDNYPFWIENTVFVVAFITITRYIFLLKHTFLAYRQRWKVAVFFLTMFLLFYLIDAINHVQTFIDEANLDVLLDHLVLKDKTELGAYIRNEIVFFGVGSFIAAVVFMLRLLLSVWRVRNRGNV